MYEAIEIWNIMLNILFQVDVWELLLSLLVVEFNTLKYTVTFIKADNIYKNVVWVGKAHRRNTSK